MKAVLQILWKRQGCLTLAVALTLLVRLVYGLVIFEHIADHFSWRGDDQYSDLAYTISISGKYAVSETSLPTMKRLPIHPLLLAGVYTVFGRSLVAARIFQCLLCAITCVMVYFTTREVTTKRVAGIASLLFAIYPNSILYSARTLSETTYSFFLSIFSLALVKQFKSLDLRMSVVTGLSYGVLMLTKSTTILLPPFLFLILLSAHYRRTLWRVVSCIVLAVFVAAIVLSPWAIRNYRLTDEFVPLSTWGGLPFYQGYYLTTHLLDGRSGRELDYEAGQEAKRLVRERYTPVGQPIDEFYQDRIAYSLVWEKILARPLSSAWAFLRNIPLAWFLTYGRLTTIVSFFVHIPLLLLATYAVFTMSKLDVHAWIKALPLVLVCAYFNLFHAVVYPHARYMAPVTGAIVTGLGAYGIAHLISLVSSSRARCPRGDPQEAGALRS
jgi:4-amino-4-deoxy-L-arabinose transferase-like glycosyltransferase